MPRMCRTLTSHDLLIWQRTTTQTRTIVVKAEYPFDLVLKMDQLHYPTVPKLSSQLLSLWTAHVIVNDSV
ncbi:uncharacterized protein H6S33_007682 [Morchella sextelata]|uniref:uncharacterized protein n=1 Tax=Morchella sextelata TaxID=1174677 RepID=UPI001D03E010|nr:uncharacterized protein H6S33_007682 [Morchella sextelata]KAH0603360.1 hypothetical protein H6S33_007682 [Morchella sextelata]